MKQFSRKMITSFILFFAMFFVGNVNVYASSNPVYWNKSGNRIALVDFNKVVFENTSEVSHTITTYDDRFDFSAQNAPGTVTGYIVDDVLYVQFNGILYWNANSSNLFNGCDNLTQIEGLQYVNTSNVTNMSNMFAGTLSLTSLDLSTFDTSNVTDMSGMFDGAEKLTSLNVSSFNTSNVTTMYRMFHGTKKLTSLVLNNFNTSNVTNMSGMFEGAESIQSLSVSSFSTINAIDMSNMFKGMKSATVLNVNSIRTTSATNLSGMFEGCSSVTTLNLSRFRTTTVTDMSNMFKGMSSLTNLTISSFDTTNVTNMSNMFNGVTSMTTLDISSFRTPSVIDMSNMFYDMHSLTTLDLSNFVTTSVTNMSGMFYNMYGLSTLSVSSFNTSNVTDMSYMFNKLRVASIDVSNFNTANVRNMSYMFAEMPNITVFNLDNFSTASVNNIDYMFYNDTSLERIWVTSLWNIPSNTSGVYVFQGDTHLGVDYGTQYDPIKVDKTQARIDTYQRSGYLNFHYTVTSSRYEVDFPNWKINALQNIFREANVVPSSNITTSYDGDYYYVYYNNETIRRFEVIRPILELVMDHENEHITIIKGKYYQLSATVYPSNTTYPKTITWTTGNNRIITIDSTGKVRGVGAGTTTATASSINLNNDSHSKSCEFEVIVPIESFTAGPYIELIPDEHKLINREILPEDTTEDTTITWTSNNTNVVTVDSTGTLTGVIPGRTTVTGVIANGRYYDETLDQLAYGLSSTVDVKVLIPIREFEVAEPSYTLYVGDSNYDNKTLTPVYRPDNYEVDGTLDWTSADTDIATVDANGKVTGVDAGTVNINATVRHYPQFQDNVSIEVKVLALGFDIKNQEANTRMDIEEGQEFTYQTEILPSNSSYTSITWSSADSTIASVDQNGKVTGVSPGTTTITAVLTNGLGRDITVTRQVKVLIPIRSFDISENSLDLYVGDSSLDHSSLTPVFSPTNYEVDDTIIWTSSDTDVATVSNGVVTGVSDGTATITGRLAHYGNQFVDTVTVNVKVLAQSLNILNQTAGTIKEISEGEEFTYQTEILPSNSSYTSITWSSSNSTIATVDQTGKVTGVTPGTVTITAVLTNGLGRDITVTRQVKVLIPIRTFELTKTDYTLYMGDSTRDHMTVVPIYTPTNYEVPGTLEWTSSDTDVVTVNDGVITAAGPGDATITARVIYYGNQFIDTVNVNVKVLAQTFNITNQDANVRMNIEEGQTYTYQTEILPANSSYTSITWSSSNTTIATVNQSGTITGVSPGDATITAVLTNGLGRDITITRDIHVQIPIRAFELTKTSAYNLYVGDSSRDHMTVVPIYTPSVFEVDGALEWTSSDTDVVTVSNGVITGVSEGTATVTARVTHYGNQFVDSVSVDVKVLTLSFDILNQEANVRMDIEEGQVFTYQTEIIPSTSSYQTVTWSSSNSTIATVDQLGRVTGVSPGNATITATLSNGLGRDITITRDIRVLVPIRSFELTNTNYDLYVGDSTVDHMTVVPIITPNNYEVDDTIEWTSSNNNIVRVNNGVITGIAEGTATITARLTHYGNQFTDSITVNVKVLALDFDIENQSENITKRIEEGHEFQYRTSITPTNSSYTSITWSSSNSTIATIDQTGKLTAVTPGDVTITATLTNGLGRDITVTRDVKVLIPIRSFELTDTSYNLYVGDPTYDHMTVVPIYTPSNYEVNGTLTWTSSDTDVVTVNDGVITGVSEGTATITATVRDYPTFTDSITVDVKVLTSSFDITNQDENDVLDIEEGEEFTYQTEILPSNTSYRTVNWYSSNSTIATVDQTGKITGVTPGDITITAILTNGLGRYITVTRDVHVLVPIRGIDITESTATLYIQDATYDHTTLHPVFTPSNYEVDDSLTWISSDSDIVTVDNGVITGHAPGYATITAKVTHYGDQLVDTVLVEVKVLAQSLNITNQNANDEMRIEVGEEFQYTTSITPSNSSYSSISWSSSNSTIATIDQTGKLRAISPGDVTITATLTNGLGRNITITRDVHVLIPIEFFDVANYEYELYVGDPTYDHDTIIPIYTPDDYEVNGLLDWESSDESVVTVDSNGVITGVGPGTAEVTATVRDYPEYYATVDVTVKVLASDLQIIQPSSTDVKQMEVGDEYTYVARVLPSNSSYKTVRWTSSNSTIAAINRTSGKVKAMSPGTVTITATLTNGLGRTITATRQIKVLKPITAFSLDEENASLYVGDAQYDNTTLTPVYAPVDHEVDGTLDWVSSDPTVATVDSTGHVVGLKEGTVTITATVHKYQQFTDSATVDVKVLASSLNITNQESGTRKDMEIGDTFTYQTEILPVNSSYTSITWSSSDGNIVSIDQNGGIRALAPGTVTITATLANGLNRTISVTRQVKVLKPITNFDITESSETLYIGDALKDNITLSPVYAPEDYEVNGTITWSSSDSTIATVDSTGHVVGLKEGTVTITATVRDYPTFTDTVTIDVKVLALGFDITNQASNTRMDMEIGDEFQYTTEISPSTSSYRTITWSSSNTSMVSINQSGKINAQAAGTVTITAVLTNGLERDITVERTVRVLKPITNFDISEQTANLYIGDNEYNNKTLTPVYAPSDYEVDGTLDWVSSDDSIVTVTSGGVITGVSEGTATITATVHNYPQYTDSVTVDVKVLASSMNITNQEAGTRMDLEVGDEFQYTTEILPATSSYRTITWSSSNTTIVSITQAGKITALTPGTVTITAVLTNGLGRDITVERTVKVLKPITNFDISQSSADLYIGDATVDNITLTPVYAPTDYEVNGTLTWVSSDPTIATVDNTGHVVGVSEGTVTVTATVTNYPQFTDSTTINVTVLALDFDITNQEELTRLDLEVGDEYQYTTSISPATSSYTSITWTSDNSSVVAVSQSGKLTALAPGTVTITAVLSNGLNRDITVERTVKVLKPITNFVLHEQSANLYIGDATVDNVTLTPVYAPTDYEVNGTLDWVSSDPTVATVDNTGHVVGLKEGTVTVTATVHDYPQFTDSITVDVKVLALRFNITNQGTNSLLELEVGDEYEYETIVQPRTSSYRSITWSSSNTSVVSIDQNGKISALTPGTVTITATLANGLGRDITIERTVKVLKPITNFVLHETSETLYVGDATVDNITLTPVYAPTDYEVDGRLDWTSSDPTIATVDNTGHVVGLREGTVTITSTVHYYPQFTDTVTIDVKVLALGLTIDNQTQGVIKEMEEGEEFTYQTTISPATSSYTSISWTSSNSTIASIDQTGKVTAIAPGTVTITATLANGLDRDIIVTRQIKVLIPIRSFAVRDTNNELYIGDSDYDHKTLVPVYNPTDFEVDGTIEWTSNDESVVTVDEHGVITAVDEGDTTVTARVTHYGNQFISTVNVSVRILTLSFTITNHDSTLMNMEVAHEYTYETNISPQNSSYKTVTWTSSVPTVATVDQTGKVRAFAPGDTTITAVLTNGLGRDITLTRDIHVLIPIENFDLQEASLDLYVGDPELDHATITKIYTPTNFEVDGTVAWTSSDPDVATVDANGTVTGVDEGEVTITGRVTHYGNQFIDTVNVRVKVLTLSFDILNHAANERKDVELGTTFTYQTEILPTNSSYQVINWSTSNQRIATISSDGVVTPREPGTVTIIAYLANGLGRDITLERTLRVPIPITGFDISEQSVDLYAGDPTVDNVTLTPVYTPTAYEVDGTIEWTSSDTDVVTVDSTGKVTAGNTEGTATITGRVVHYENQFIDTVTVNTKILALEYNITNYENTRMDIEIGDTFDYETEIIPHNASYTTVSWISSDPTKVSVDQTGHIEALSPGTVTIATTLANGLNRTIVTTRRVKVLKPVTAFEVTEQSVDLYVGDPNYDNVTLTPIVTPEDNEVDDTILWTSSDTDVVTVDQTGKVTTGTIEGTATITARIPHYGNQFIDTVNVNVKVLALNYNITNHDSTRMDMEVGDTFDYETEILPTNSSYR